MKRVATIAVLGSVAVLLVAVAWIRRESTKDLKLCDLQPPEDVATTASSVPVPILASPETSAPTSPEIAVIPRRPHASVRDLLASSGIDANGLQLTPEILEGVDVALRVLVPDFAIKDGDRPWLDRQYVPVGATLSPSAKGIEVIVSLVVHTWDEGRPGPTTSLDVRFRHTAEGWVPVEVPAPLAEDQHHAATTLQGDWAPGERVLAP